MKRMRYECCRAWDDDVIDNEPPEPISRLEVLAELNSAMTWAARHLSPRGKISLHIHIEQEFEYATEDNGREVVLDGGAERRADSKNRTDAAYTS